MIGLGIDAVEIERFTHWSTFSHQKLKRLYTDQEILYCLSISEKAAERFAVRFAAKEALYKALSPLCTSLPLLAFFSFCEVTLHRGIPAFHLEWEKLGLPELSVVLSLTHTKSTAIAVVLLTPKD